MIERLVAAGMDVARLNFSHGTPEEHGRALRDIRRAAGRQCRAVAVLQDLAGPKIRVGVIGAGAVNLESGRPFVLTSRSVPGDAASVSVTYRDLPADVRKGDAILLSDGALELEVEAVEGPDIRCRVVVGGPLNAHKGVNLPGRTLRAGILTAKDRADLAFGLEQGVDYIGLSFVRNAADVEEVRRAVRAGGRDTPLIAKIEKHEALQNLDEIVAAADGLMVARGDLGVETPLEDIPRAQKTVIAKANRAAKPVITATQMLKSMVENPRPTRAEVTDVANAILDGSDAVMLSEETTVGRHPVEAVEMMARTALGAEAMFPFAGWRKRYEDEPDAGPPESVADAACHLARDLGAAAILTCTQSGSTTRLVSKYRPRAPILGMTPDDSTYRQLALVWGVVPLRMPPSESEDDIVRQALRIARESGHVRAGETVVIIAGLPLHVPGATNLIRVAVA
jgi:pyruvate kinase